MQLQLLTAAGQRVVTEEFLKNPSRLAPIAGQVEGFPRRVELGELTQALEGALTNFKAGDDALDEALAPAVHRALPLTRREASIDGLWHFLSVFVAPDFVRHRWKAKSEVWPRERFLGSVAKNTFARLWWMAELTRNGADYALTSKFMKRTQDFTQLVYFHNFGRCRAAVEAFILASEGEKLGTVRELAKVLKRVAVTLPLELMSADEIVQLLEEAAPRARQLAKNA